MSASPPPPARDRLEGSARLPPRALRPRYWPTWALAGVLVALARLPRAARLALGRVTGEALRMAMRRRRTIAERNIEHCLPHLDARARRRLLVMQFHELGIALYESVAAWSAARWRIERLARVRGRQHLDAAQARGRGVLIVSGHFLSLDMALQMLTLITGGYGVYRRHKNPVLDYLILRGRERQGVRLFPREDMRTPLRALREGRFVWFSPDQDHGIDRGAFVPFFGRRAATVTTVARLAARTGAAVVPLVYRRLPGAAGYELEFLAPLEGLAGQDTLSATRRINHFIERQAYVMPSQYLWLHRRFKTRAPGEPGIYD